MALSADGGSTTAPEQQLSNPVRADEHLARGGAIVLFDGLCNLCNASVVFIMDRDKAGHFAFASLQSAEAARLLAERGYDGPEPRSVLLVEGKSVSARSTAALRIARRLGGAWRVLSVLMLVPRSIRDALYDWVGRNRYRWFGRAEVCRVPANRTLSSRAQRRISPTTR